MLYNLSYEVSSTWSICTHAIFYSPLDSRASTPPHNRQELLYYMQPLMERTFPFDLTRLQRVNLGPSACKHVLGSNN